MPGYETKLILSEKLFDIIEEYSNNLLEALESKEKKIDNEKIPIKLKKKIKYFLKKFSTLLQLICIKHAKAGKYFILKKYLEYLKPKVEKVYKELGEDYYRIKENRIIMVDLAIVQHKGMIEDNVLKEGFDVINCYDYREWLKKNGALDITLNSSIVQGVYGLVFGGDKQYSFEAGTALRGLLRLGLTYKGHVYYRMMAGMGDAIFAPMYEVLESRGVDFQFFNKVSNIGLAEDKKSIKTITIDIQATLKSKSTKYNPLVNINGLPSWPNEPLFEQLVEGEELKAQNINLESYYSKLNLQTQTKILKIGEDFDEVVLGISIGALPSITKEFDTEEWKNMLKHVIPIPTVAFQLWLKSSIEKMGWEYGNSGFGLVGSYQAPYDTWADMSDLIACEFWPNDILLQT